MAGGPIPSNDSPRRRAFRLAFGVTLCFVLAQLFSWPVSFLAPVIAVVLLQDAEPLPIWTGLKILGTVALFFLGGFLLAFFLLPYPAVMLLTASLLVYRLNFYLVTSGAHLLLFIAAILACLVVPVLMKFLPELGMLAEIGVFLSFVVGMLGSWIAFALVPATPAPAANFQKPPTYDEAAYAANALTIVIAPLYIGFLVFGWSSILVLIYGVLIATELSSQGSLRMGWKKVIANVVFGAIGMLIVYEMLVMAPSIPLMIALVFAASIIFGIGQFKPGPRAGLWNSGFYGFLILLGGVLLKEDADAGVKIMDRVIQIALASAYVAFAYQVVDTVKHYLERPVFSASRKAGEA